MSVHINENKGTITFSNRISYRYDVFEFKKPVTYNTKRLTLDDGTPVIWGYLEDDEDCLNSTVLPLTIFGKTYNDVLINAYLQIANNYFFDGTNVINDPVVKCCL